MGVREYSVAGCGKNILLLIMLSLLLFFTSCDMASSSAPSTRDEFVEEECKVISVSKSSKFAGTWHKTVTVEVYCSKYNITKTFTSHSQGIFGTNNAWGLDEGDTVMVSVKKRIRNSDDAILDVYLLNITNYNP